MNDPLVSIIMPFHNAAQFITSAVHSVLAQTYENWELLMVNDGSVDHSVQLVAPFVSADHRVHLFHNDTNSGVAFTRNAAIKRATGAFIAFLDADDLWQPDKLTLQVGWMCANGYGLTYTAHGFIDENDNVSAAVYTPPLCVSHRKLFHTNVMCCSSVVVKTELMKRHLFDQAVFHEDFMAWLLITKEIGAAHGVSNVLTHYRIMKGTKSANKLVAAKGTFNIYRQQFGFGWLKSGWLMLFYTANGLKKYSLRHRNSEKK